MFCYGRSVSFLFFFFFFVHKVPHSENFFDRSLRTNTCHVINCKGIPEGLCFLSHPTISVYVYRFTHVRCQACSTTASLPLDH